MDNRKTNPEHNTVFVSEIRAIFSGISDEKKKNQLTSPSDNNDNQTYNISVKSFCKKKKNLIRSSQRAGRRCFAGQVYS